MLENEENRRNAGEGAAGLSNPKSESSPNDDVRKCCDREKRTVATPAELICESPTELN